MKTINTLISSNLKTIGNRICEKCGEKVPIIENNGKRYSHCLNCENKAIQLEVEDFIEKNRAEVFFKNNSLVPSDTEDCRFENYLPKNDSQREALKKAKWYAENFEELINEGKWNSLLFQGTCGIGKSHLSHSIAMVLKEKKYKVIFVDTPMLMKRIRSTYGKNEDSEIAILKRIEEADLLVLDDIGAEYVKSTNGEESWATDILFSIINSRVDKPNVFTTNYNSAGLTEKYGYHGERIVSRMMKGTKKIKLEGKDYRTQEW